MKYWIIVLVALFLLFSWLAAGSPPPATEASDALLGEWAGRIEVAGTILDITITFSRDATAPISGALDCPAQGAVAIPLGNIKVEGPKVCFIIDHPGAPGDPAFEGELGDAKKSISGTFCQSGLTGTFTLQKK